MWHRAWPKTGRVNSMNDKGFLAAVAEDYSRRTAIELEKATMFNEYGPPWLIPGDEDMAPPKELAKIPGLNGLPGHLGHAVLDLVRQEVAKEREACAKLADKVAASCQDDHVQDGVVSANVIAMAIRARSKQ